MLADNLTRCIQHTIHTCPTNVQSNPTRGARPAAAPLAVRTPRSVQWCPAILTGARAFFVHVNFHPLEGLPGMKSSSRT